jgi:DNA processing protein
MLPKMGPVRLRRLLGVFGEPDRVLSAKRDALCRVEGIGPDVANAIVRWESLVDLGAELDRIERAGVTVLTEADAEYPSHLAQIHNPPIALYVRGSLEPRDNRAIGVVGSRKASHYGLESAKKLSYQLAYSGMTVVSGLARGIDTMAHQAALAAKGRTIAVLGSGLNELYPPENAELADRIAASGAVASEFSMGVKADVQTFPMRNRIVAGWGTGVLVVEAGLNSGAMITAAQALDQGRQVYAVPGQIDRPSAAGSNRLIQQGAKLVAGVGDILEDLGSLFPEMDRPMPTAAAALDLNEAERAVYEAIGDDETAIDAIVEKSRLPTGSVSSTLLRLEMKRLVKQLPGQYFVKLL